MENAVDALKMAAAVLVFILALSISINAFGQARVASQTILDYNDREYDYTYVNPERDGNKLVTERTVGIETVIPTIYKSFLENYKVVFVGSSGKNIDTLYSETDENNNLVSYTTIDMVNKRIGGATESTNPKLDFLEALLYGKNSGFSINSFQGVTFNNTYWDAGGIYGAFSNYQFRESVGIYYQDEENGIDPDNNVPDANKMIKRVITYTRVN